MKGQWLFVSALGNHTLEVIDLKAGKRCFLLPIFGHRAYLGPDFTADYLHRAALIASELNGSSSETLQERTIGDLKANWRDSFGVLNYSAPQTA